MSDNGRAIRTAPLLLGFFAAALAAGAPESDEIFRLLPTDVGACLVVEDLGEHLDRVEKSGLKERFERLGAVQAWKRSPTHQSVETAAAAFPLYFGVSNEQLVRDVLGGSVVFAFCPPRGGAPPTGIFACRAESESTLAKVVEHITRPSPSRQIAEHVYRGVRFVERTEFETRKDFVLRIGAVAVISDKPEAVRRVVDAWIDGKGLYDAPRWREMRASVGDGALAYLLMNMEELAPLLQEALQKAGPTASWLEGYLRSLEWASAGVRFAGRSAEISVHGAVAQERLPQGQRDWPEWLGRPSGFWRRVPADAVAAAATELDFGSLAQLLKTATSGVPEMQDVFQVAERLVVGFDAEKDVLPKLGPEMGLVAVQGPQGRLEVVVEIELRAEDQPPPAVLPLPETIELAVLRPLLVFYSVDHNNHFDDDAKVETIACDFGRIHALTDSRALPPGLAPAFLVRPDRIYFGSSPEAILARRTPEARGLESSRHFAEFRGAAGEDAVLKAYLNVGRLREYVAFHRGDLAERISEQGGEPTDVVAGRISEVSDVLSLVEFVALSTSTSGRVRSWTLSVFFDSATP
jgi:hypothetical protein